MKVQNYANHIRFVPGYHYVASTGLLAVLIGSIINLLHSSKENVYSASLILVLTVICMIIWLYMRIFALKAQDRAIRAEENFRHFILTGKPLDKQLHLAQIIALRFASDEEFPALAQKAITENLSDKEIKKAIQHWRADYHRV
ncbi:MAG: hypothetical protein KGO81_05725 [Bacteroidota bacterium]|nr:hypothetical protein [Bacteroidota bacterium]